MNIVINVGDLVGWLVIFVSLQLVSFPIAFVILTIMKYKKDNYEEY